MGAVVGAFVLELSPMGLDKGCGKPEVSEIEIGLSEGWRKGADGRFKTRSQNAVEEGNVILNVVKSYPRKADAQRTLSLAMQHKQMSESLRKNESQIMSSYHDSKKDHHMFYRSLTRWQLRCLGIALYTPMPAWATTITLTTPCTVSSR